MEKNLEKYLDDKVDFLFSEGVNQDLEEFARSNKGELKQQEKAFKQEAKQKLQELKRLPFFKKFATVQKKRSELGGSKYDDFQRALTEFEKFFK